VSNHEWAWESVGPEGLSDEMVNVIQRLIVDSTGEYYPEDKLLMLPLAQYWGDLVLIDEHSGEIGGVLWSMRISSSTGRVLAFVVSPELRGAGRGAEGWKLFTSLAAQKGISDIQLEVREENDVALNMYHRRGLNVHGRIPGYYQQTDGLLMRGPVS
jgi:ribosomal protein S18 acetylase RimI-like enzyme